MTAEQQIALASVIASGSVGLAAVLGSFLGGFLDRRHARNLARTERNQARLERTYLELVGFVHRRRLEANGIQGQAPPVAVSAQEIERVQSLVASIASEKVRAILLDEFSAVLGEIRDADAMISDMELVDRVTGEPRNPADWGGVTASDCRERIHDAQRKLIEIESRLHEQIRSELRK